MSMATNVAIDPRLPALYAEVGGLVGIDVKMDNIIKLLTDEEADGGFWQQLKVVNHRRVWRFGQNHSCQLSV